MDELSTMAPKATVTRAVWGEKGFRWEDHTGDAVEEDIVDEIVNSLPPASLRANYVQCGEAWSHEYDPEKQRWRPTFLTFAKIAGGIWICLGNCFHGAIAEPKNRRKEPWACATT